jgi:Double zinc ribbon
METVVCPSCQARLRLPNEAPPGGMTCPRCDAHVPNPTSASVEPASLQTASPPPAGIQGEPTDPQPARPLGFSKCPLCKKDVEPDWLFCPHCEGLLRHENSSRTGGKTRVMIQLLRAFGLFGIGYFFLGVVALMSAPLLLTGVVTLWCVGLVSAGVMFYRTRHDTSQRSLWRVLVDAVTLVGACVAVSVALIVAIFVFFWVSCMVGLGR